MSDDPLGSFRRRVAGKPGAPELVVNRPGERQPYEAFAAKDKLLRLDIRCREDSIAHAVSYNYMPTISYNRRTYGELVLVVSGLTAIIKGRALRPIIEALKLHTCEFIQEFDPGEFDEPTDREAPYVESITVDIIGRATTAASGAAAR